MRSRRSFCFARSQTPENVLGDFCHMRLAGSENPGPVRRRRGEDDAIIGINAHRSLAPPCKICGILRPFGSKFADAQDNEVRGRTIVVARDRETTSVYLVGDRGTVTLVADQGVIRSEGVAIAQPCSFEHPMVGVLDRIANRFALAPPLATAMAVADAGPPVFRIEPKPLVKLSIGPGEERFVANESGVVVDEVNPPPARVTAKKGHVAAGLLDKGCNVAPHALAPIFVVTDAEKEPVPGDKIR